MMKLLLLALLFVSTLSFRLGELRLRGSMITLFHHVSFLYLTDASTFFHFKSTYLPFTLLINSPGHKLHATVERPSVVSTLSERTTITSVSYNKDTVDVQFADDSSFRFHTMWLRDACRDDEFVKTAAGEKILHKTLLVEGIDGVHAIDASIGEGNRLEVQLANNQKCSFDPEMLRAYAPTVAKVLTKQTIVSDVKDPLRWLRPYTGIPGAPAPKNLDLWTATSGVDTLPLMSYEEAMTPAGNLKLLRHLLSGAGCCKISKAPNPGEEGLHEFADYVCNGLQKDPSRDEANWVIRRKETAASVSYNPKTRLNNHSDQSLPNHGIPAIFLLMHYAAGWGANTFVDAFAAAEALREKDLEAFELLTKYGNDQERDLLASRQDAVQSHTASLCLTSANPMIQLDGHGNIKRVQYNEVFRVPSTVPYDKFKDWYAAYLKFAGMLESNEFEREVPMAAGDFMIMNNWRVLHGRAGSKTGDKDIGKVNM